jgi:hypothetical protein
MALAPLLLGITLWALLAATAWKYKKIRPALARHDQIGAIVCGGMIGLPAFIVGLALVAQSWQA